MPFKQLEGDTAIVAMGGVYRQCDLYEWNGGLFAKTAGGFIRLYGTGATSKEKMRLEMLYIERKLWQDRFGRLSLKDGHGFTAVAPQPDGRILALEATK